MRATVLGTVLAVAFLAALFGVAYYYSPSGRALSPPLPGASLSARPIRPGFTVIQRTGAWTLECLQPRKAPEWIRRMKESWAKSNGSPPSPVRPCHVISEVNTPGHPTEWVDVIFNIMPKGGFLTALFRINPDLVSPGDYLDLRLTDGHQRVRVVFCGPEECAAVPVVRPQDLATVKTPQAERIVASNETVLSIPAVSGERPLAFNIPMYGLPAVIAELRRRARPVQGPVR